MSRRIHAKRPIRTKVRDEMVELSPHVHLFIPAWAIKRAAKGKST